MKNFKNFLSILVIFILSVNAEAQTLVASGNPLNLPCGGGNVDLTALGTSSTSVFGDDFNTGGVSPGWAASAAAQFDNPCGPSVDGSTYLWMGPGTAAPREMTTAAVDVSCGGTVCFDFKFMPEGSGTQSAPCEGADLYNEGVSLQYSIDGGATWIDFAYFAPNGDLLTSYPGGVTSPSANGATNFTTWQNYCFTIPAGGETGTTMFQLHQWGSSGSNYDHWGIDNFYVYADPCFPYYYDWDFLPGFPDAPDVTTNVTSTTTFTVCYTNGIDSICESITVIVDELPPAVVTVTGGETCAGQNDGTVIIDNPGGQGPYNIVITGPYNDNYTEGNGPPDDLNIYDLPPGTYNYTTTQFSGGCSNSGTFVIAAGPPCCDVEADSVDVLCNGGTTGAANAIPIGGVPPYTYLWDDPLSQTTQTASNLPAGTYTVTLSDAIGCVEQATVVVLEPTPLVTGNTPAMVSCFGACDGSIDITPASGGTPGYTYNLNGGVFGGVTNFPSLCAGTYTVIAEDNNGCQVIMGGINITQPTVLTLTETANVAATCGASNGSFTVVQAGGTPGYTFDIGSGPQGTGVFTGLLAGNYTVTVTDLNGCTALLNITIDSNPGPAPFIDALVDATCAGGLNGSVTIGAGGGTAPFTYSMDAGPAQSTNVYSNVGAGAHTVTVTDINGCTGDVTFNISQPTPLIFTTVVSDATCFGVCDGEIDISASGAVPPYTYSDNNGLTFQAGNILTGLCAGNVNVVVQDANGCLTNSLEIIAEPTIITSVQTATDPACYQTPTGEIAFIPSGGTPGYSFSSDNGATFSGSSPLTGLMAGTYDIIVQDANGCQFTDQVTLTDPPPFTFTYIANNPSNCGASDGSFEIVATAGAAPYIYSIDGGANWQVNNGFFLNLFSGLYTLIVQDVNGCVDSVYEALSDNVMVTSTDFTADATCYNGSDGAGVVSQQFGAPPFTYTINTTGVTQGSGVFTGLTAGTYYIIIEDDGLCIGIEQFEIFQPDSITYTPILTDITCPQGADGAIDFGVVVGGNGGPYTYSIDGGATFQAGSTFTGLTSGTYDLLAMDGNACLGGIQVTLGEAPPFTAVINATDLTCNGNASGFVQIVADGATAPYDYTMVGTNTTGIFAGLSANTYNITIIDVNGCTFDTTQIITEPSVLTGSYVAIDALCFGSFDGQVDVTAGGGAPPFTYSYSSDGGVTSQSNPSLTGLSAGTYIISIQDANGCQLDTTLTINEPTQLTMNMVVNPATCGLNNGDITITGANGTPGYLYSNDNGASFQPSNFFGGLAPINYNVVLMDANGCQIDQITSVPADILPTIDNIVTTQPLCNGDFNGTITVTSSGGVGIHQYSSDGGLTYQASNVFTGLNAGSYSIFVIDDNGCTATTLVDIVDPVLLTFVSVSTGLDCNGDFTGAIDITENGGTPMYQYSIDNGVSFQGGGSFGFIAAGTYDIVVVDANGCQAIGQEIVVEPTPLTLSLTLVDPLCYNACNGTGQAVVGGGTAPYTYGWFGGIGSPTIPEEAENACPGTYSLVVADAHGCQIDSLDFVFNNPPQLGVTSVTGTDLLCYQDGTGEIDINAPTATQFSIDGGQTFQAGNVFTGLQIGTYDIVVLDGSGCEGISNISLFQPDSLYSLAPSDWVGCYGNNVEIQAFTNGGSVPYNYTWTNNVNGTVVNTATFIHINDSVAPGYDFTLNVTDANGCPAAPITFNVQAQSPLLAIATNDTTICDGGTAVLGVTASGGELIDFGSYLGYAYFWDTGVVGDTLETVSVTPTVLTQYIVSVTDLCGQVVEDTVVVDIYVDPTADIVGGGNGCVPESMSFINPSYIAGSSLLWDFGDGNVSTGVGTVSNLYTSTGCFDVTLTVTSPEGCSASQTFADLVCINGLPEAAFTWNPWSPSVMDPTVSVKDLSNGAESYEYTFMDELDNPYITSYEQNPTYTYPVDVETRTKICQKVTSLDGCIDSVCQVVLVHEEILFYVPNVFTPDGDPYNQSFFPVFTAGVDPYDYHLTIFNRWGEIIFESYNYDYGWNGHYGDGGLVQDGVYVWQIEFGEKLTDKKQIHRGHVTILK